MTHAAVRVSAARRIGFGRNKRARRFWRSMDAALREAGLGGKVVDCVVFSEARLVTPLTRC